MAFNLVQNFLGQVKPLIFTIHTGETLMNKYTKQNELFPLPSTWLNKETINIMLTESLTTF